jgi:hypothetical protein
MSLAPGRALAVMLRSPGQNVGGGCPFPCTYCAARMYNELYEQVGGEYGRRRPVEDVVINSITIERS